MAHHVIYLPGVGDHQNAQIQINALRKWNKFNLETHYLHINWNDNESFKSKLYNVIKIIDELYETDEYISLVGASAGASMAINAYSARKDKINAVVLICGKINNPQTLGDGYKNRNPRLLESVSASSENSKNLTRADKSKMITLLPIYDGVVELNDGWIEGVKNKTMFSVFHAIAIYLSISLYKRTSINFIKSKRVQ
jgi:predicted peptidase